MHAVKRQCVFNFVGPVMKFYSNSTFSWMSPSTHTAHPAGLDVHLLGRTHKDLCLYAELLNSFKGRQQPMDLGCSVSTELRWWI